MLPVPARILNLSPFCLQATKKSHANGFFQKDIYLLKPNRKKKSLKASGKLWISFRPISTCQLNMLPCLHLTPIYLVLSKGSCDVSS